MNCTSSRELLGAYLDEELDAGLQTEVQSHLAACHACSDAYARLRERQADIRSHAPRYEAPVVLLASVRKALRDEAANQTRAGLKTNRSWGWVAIAASILLCISVGWNLVLLRSRTPERDVLAENLLSSHVRSLIGTHLVDVPSSDQHTVKPWFNGKLDFSPDVKDLTSQGFPLLGGRIEYISERPVAALVYGRRKHIINLCTWPATAAPGVSRWSRQGYNLVHWSKGGMDYWAISDITVEELQQFRDLYGI
jgi:anti-sigma factor RsiW